MKKEKLEWRTEKRKVSDLVPYAKNPRKITDKQREELEESIKKFNLAEIPAVNTDNKIVAGHQRVAALVALGRGEEEIEVRVPNRELTKEEFREYLLRSNKNTGGWDNELLKEFDIEMLLGVGFDDDELAYLWDDVTEIEDDGFNIEKAKREIKTPTTKPGDIYQLGSHRLMCGDSTKKEDVEKLMGGVQADTVYCDPPYNIGLDYSKGVTTKGKYGTTARRKKPGDMPNLKYTGIILNDRKKIEDYKNFIRATAENALEFSKPNLHFFYWCDENFIWVMQTIFAEVGLTPKRVCLWIKNNFIMTPQIAFNKVYEPCVYGVRGKPYLSKTHKNLNEILNKEVESGVQVLDEIAEMLNIWLVSRDPGQDYEHPTQKPLSLHEKPLKRCTRPGDLILDLFGGSGSTLIACEQLKRKAYLCELDAIFCDVIINRWETFTKQKAKLIRDASRGQG